MLRAALSLWIVIHLAAVLIAPNRTSVWTTPTVEGRVSFYEENRSWVDAYLAPLGLLSTWGYFAPEPGSPPMFLDWEGENSRGDVVAFGSYPDPKANYFWNDRMNRRVTSIYFMIAADDRAERMLVPYFCNQLKEKGVERLRLYRRLHKLPIMEDVKSGRVSAFNWDDFERHWISTTFCKRNES